MAVLYPSLVPTNPPIYSPTCQPMKRRLPSFSLANSISIAVQVTFLGNKSLKCCSLLVLPRFHRWDEPMSIWQWGYLGKRDRTLRSGFRGAIVWDNLGKYLVIGSMPTSQLISALCLPQPWALTAHPKTRQKARVLKSLLIYQRAQLKTHFLFAALWNSTTTIAQLPLPTTPEITMFLMKL